MVKAQWETMFEEVRVPLTPLRAPFTRTGKMTGL